MIKSAFILILFLAEAVLFAQNGEAPANRGGGKSGLAGASLSTYSGDHKILGQALRDPVMAGKAVITVNSLPRGNYRWNLGSSSGASKVENGQLRLTPEDLEEFRSGLSARSSVKLTLRRGAESREFNLSYRPSEIHTWQDLQAMRRDLSGVYVQMNDIAFPDSDGDGVGDYSFEPVGRDLQPETWRFQGPPFSGIFDGQNFTISRLYAARPGEDYVGLFGKVDPSAKVKNVVLEHVKVEGREMVGALAGAATDRNASGRFHEIVDVSSAYGDSDTDMVGRVDYSENEFNFGANVFALLFINYARQFQAVAAPGFNIGYALKIDSRWAWELSYRFGYPVGGDFGCHPGLHQIRTGFRFVLPPGSSVKLVLRSGIGVQLYFIFVYGGLGMRISLGTRWFTDIGVDYLWPETSFLTAGHAIVPHLNAGFQW